MLGYSTDEKPGIVVKGPQPWEGYVSDVCEMFGIGPIEAVETIVNDENLVIAIADYRGSKRAVEEFSAEGKEAKERAFKVLEKNPGLIRLLAKMHRAQVGAPLNATAADLESEGWKRGDLIAEAANENEGEV